MPPPAPPSPPPPPSPPSPPSPPYKPSPPPSPKPPNPSPRPPSPKSVGRRLSEFTTILNMEAVANHSSPLLVHVSRSRSTQLLSTSPGSPGTQGSISEFRIGLIAAVAAAMGLQATSLTITSMAPAESGSSMVVKIEVTLPTGSNTKWLTYKKLQVTCLCHDAPLLNGW